MSICVATLPLFKSNFRPANTGKRSWVLWQALLLCHDTLVGAGAVLINIVTWLISQASELCPRCQCIIYRLSFEKHGLVHLTLFSMVFFFLFCIVNEELSLSRRLQPPLLRSSRDLLCCTSSFSISVLDLLI